MKFKLKRVQYIPKELKINTLYVSEEYDIAIHLCACGCGSKIRTPLGPTEWRFRETNDGPSLYPSVGNWQLPCRSHYWIDRGEIKWASRWTAEQIKIGRRQEEERRREYYEILNKKRINIWQCFLSWVKKIFFE